MKLQKILKVGGAVGLATLVLPVLVFAQTGITGPVGPPDADFGFQEVIGVMNTLVTWIFTIFIILAVIMVIVAAFFYLTSGGDGTKVKKATQMVVFAAVAIAVALLAISIRYIVENLLGVQVSNF